MESVSLVVAIISPAFQTRPFCIAELGAAWSQVGKLFPIAIPGLERTDMEGVLTGLAVRYLSDSAALDELHDQICNLIGTNPGAKTWGRHKSQWLVHVDDYVKQLPKLRIINPKDYDRAIADLEGTRDALREAEAMIHEQDVKMERLASAKSADEVTEILLPEGELDRYYALVQQVMRAIRGFRIHVRDAIWYELDGREMPWRTSSDSGFDKTLDDGWIKEGPTGHGVVPNADFDEVRTAIDAVGRLNSFLTSNDLSESFDQWFRSKYHASPNLRHKRVWDEIFPARGL
jgi:hypothetical protein